MLSIKKISEVLGKSVYTDNGEFIGRVEEVNISDNKIDGWRIRLAGHRSYLIGGAKGIIIPHNFVKAIGDVFVVSRAALPSMREEEMNMSETQIEEA